MEELTRKCPICDMGVKYKSPISHKKSLKENKPCKKCSSIERANRPEQKLRLKTIASQIGEKNPFYGKTHSDISKKKISDKMLDISSKRVHPMIGKTVHEIWVEKYGEETANIKFGDLKRKHSENNKGEKNPMYGKPSPTGSGNGWSGWYKGWYFRSLRELTYMVKVIERFNLKWVSGESNQHKIEYIDYKGDNRNYFPDFIIDGKYIIECKPKKLWNSDNVVRKTEAALKYCELNGLVYKKRDIGVLSNLEIKYLYENGDIKFLDRYEERYKKDYNC